MNSEREGLKSPNWVTGMLLTPEQFLRQESYIDDLFGWLLRYCVAGTGLVGGGVRVDAAVRGVDRFDPRVEVHDDGVTVRAAVLQARGITPQGEPVEITDQNIARGEFRKADLAGLNELLVFVQRSGGKEEDAASVGLDPANPNQAALRRPRYRVHLGAEADQLAASLAVAQIRRASQTLSFELDGQFIPPCATVLAHSALYSSWLGLQAEVLQLAGQFAELHRTVARYADQIAQRGIDTRGDHDILAFVERAVLALDACAYDIMDPTLPPDRLFQQIDRAGRRSAIALDLSAATQLFFQLLSGADASYTSLLEEERQTLAGQRTLARADVRHSVLRAKQTLARLQRLVEALNGKYVDYRINRTLDALRFLLDEGGEQFYAAVATPGYPQRDGDVLTFVFSQLSLTGRHEYRVVLLGDPQGISSWHVGDELHVDLRINSTAGPGRPISRTVACEVPGQRNFAVNFDTPPDVATISGLQVTVQPGHRVRGAVLFQRRLGLAPEPAVAPPPSGPPRPAPTRPAPSQGAPGETATRPTTVIKVRKPRT